VRQADLRLLERRISPERLAPYRAAADGDLVRAVRLYEQNAELSAAFWMVLCDVEILLRNAVHEQLRAWSDDRYSQPAWYLDPGRVFNAQARADIAAARQHLAATGRRETPGRLVAELPFGFWRFLLSARYERTLWLPCLRTAFPGIAGHGLRRDVHDAVRELHLLRNRIAHHEPVYNRPLGDLHDLALTTAGWVCPVTRRWIARRSTVPALLRSQSRSAMRRPS
jgi:hypothetical protein